MVADAVIHHNGNDRRIVGVGNGRLDAVSNAIKHYFDVDYQLAFYEEHSLTKGYFFESCRLCRHNIQ